jgi:undecaprenyl diphosphate synthase
MTRTAETATPRAGLHVGIIMDGNGRWAERRGLPRPAGHRAGLETARRIVEAAPGMGVEALTLYAFSADNWRRPETEVRALMTLLREYLAREAARCAAQGVRLRVVGQRDRIAVPLRDAIERAERATAAGAALDLRVAVDYSGRDALVAAAPRCGDGTPSRERFAAALAEVMHAGDAARDVDLLVRTGGEQRLSDFLLWECAYAELWFTPALWPDFTPADLARALGEFAGRERRFGGLGSEGRRRAAS